MAESCDLYARILLDRIQYKEFPVKPREIVQRLGIFIQEVPASGNFDGYLLKCGDTFGIMVNASIKSETRKNFTIAHELGHYEIPHHKGREFKCLSSSIGIMMGKDLEVEANDFAAELLMPVYFVEEKINNNPISLDVMKAIAKECETSFTSSAIRYIKFCPALAVIVVSEGGKIKFSILSEQARERFGHQIISNLQKGLSLNNLSLAYDFFKSGESASELVEVSDMVDISAWFPGFDYSRFDCREASMKLAGQNQVISLVWLNEKSSYYEDDDDF